MESEKVKRRNKKETEKEQVRRQREKKGKRTIISPHQDITMQASPACTP